MFFMAISVTSSVQAKDSNPPQNFSPPNWKNSQLPQKNNNFITNYILNP
jgi:hypothetical protein